MKRLWSKFCELFGLTKATNETRFELLIGLLSGSVMVFPMYWDDAMKQMACYAWAYHGQKWTKRAAYMWALLSNLLLSLIAFVVVIVVGLIAVAFRYRGKDV